MALNTDELSSLGSISVDNFVFVKDTLTSTDSEGNNLLPTHPASEPENRIKEMKEQVKQRDWQNATLKETLKLA